MSNKVAGYNLTYEMQLYLPVLATKNLKFHFIRASKVDARHGDICNLSCSGGRCRGIANLRPTWATKRDPQKINK